MASVVNHAEPLSGQLERIRINNHPCLLASFSHPSAHGDLNWGTDERRPYLSDVVIPTVEAIHREVSSA
jgi:hypothetical protein